MTQKLFSSLTASLLIATLSISTSSNATPVEQTKQGSNAHLKQTPNATSSETAVETVPSSNKSLSPETQSREVIKVGEQLNKPEPVKQTIAKVQSHELSGRKAATLYVRNIPVLTFKSSITAAKGDTKIGTQLKQSSSDQLANNAQSFSRTKALSPSSLTSLLKSSESLSAINSKELHPNTLDAISSNDDDPIWKATTIAARLNQLYHQGLDADKITVAWGGQPATSTAGRDRYLIQADTIKIAVIDANTVLPDSTRNSEQDALQATNRLRRLLGDASPLREVTGKPPAWRNQVLSLGPIQLRLTGFASWYGPGFHGNRSASGEVFNQNAMTAAHRTLPFGTRVLVTNMDNGQSVMVRINDRGPFHGNRIIDLSAAAARVLGVMQSGVALVKLEVVDSRSASTVSN